MEYSKGAVRAVTLFVIGCLAWAIFIADLNLARADTLGGHIVCLVYSNLNIAGAPIPLMSASDCAATSTPSGGGTLEVVKIVSGGSAQSSDFEMHVMSGGTEITGSPQPGSASGISFVGLSPGRYSVSESSASVDISQYAASYSATCPRGVVSVASSSIPVVCTITNTYIGATSTPPTTGTLVVKKVFASGTTTPSLFSFSVDGGTPLSFDASGENDLTLAPGTYSVVEAATSTYGASYDNCTNVSVIAGATTTCTITNSLVSPPPSTESDLSLTKTVDTSSPNPGDTVTYTLTVHNAGPANASGAAVTDVLPSGVSYVSDDGAGAYASSTGLWTIGTLADGSSATLHIKALVGSGTGGHIITNSASVTDTNGDPNSANDSSSASFTTQSPANNTGGGGGGGGGGNGPIPGSLGVSAGGNGPVPQVLGASTSTVQVPIVPCSQFLTAFIRFGANNDSGQVTRLQQFLDQFENANLTVNGVYDAPTLAALKAFQGKYAAEILTPWGIAQPTGYVYLTTRKMVNEIYCNYTQQFPLSAAQQAIINASRTASVAADKPVAAPAPKPKVPAPPAPATVTPSTPLQPANVTATLPLAQSAAADESTGNPVGDFFSGLFDRIFGR